MKKIIKICLSILVLLTICACQNKQNDIIIIYTNDVHASVNTNIGYDGLMSYINKLKANNDYVTVVDAGDAYQGSTACAVSKGEAIAKILKYVDYDIMTFGNHEFDYGMDQLINNINISEKHYINSNIVYTGKNEDNFLNDIKKYEIIEYGNIKVGFVSFDTPLTLNDTVPTSFMEDGDTVYDFCFNDSKDNFYINAQKVIDECKNEGADYIIAITHLGQDDDAGMFASNEFVLNTNNIDVVIDAHSHLELAGQYNINKDGKEVLITSSGTGLNNIGQVVISPNGFISTSLISNYSDKDEELEKIINDILDEYTNSLLTPIFTNEYELKIADDNGIRMIRNRELAIGDLVADAIRYYANADIGIMNGGGFKANLPKGEVSYNDFIKVFPYGNALACIEISGQELLDYLEYCYSNVLSDYYKDDKAIGENGSFMQISGLKITIDTSVKSSVVVDDTDNFVSVGETRRIKDVLVLNKNNEYEPIDINKTYKLGGMDYSLIKGGSGTSNIFKDNNVLISGSMYDYELFASYIKDILNNDLSKYQIIDERIIIE